MRVGVRSRWRPPKGYEVARASSRGGMRLILRVVSVVLLGSGMLAWGRYFGDEEVGDNAREFLGQDSL